MSYSYESSSIIDAEQMATGKSHTNQQIKKHFSNTLYGLYNAEWELRSMLPGIKSSATTNLLQHFIIDYLRDTETHLEFLEEIFILLKKKKKRKKTEAIEGLLREINNAVDSTSTGTLARDVALIINLQKIQHYKIATYASLIQLTGLAGITDITTVLHPILLDEKEADNALSVMAIKITNWQAISQEIRYDEERE